MKTIGEHLGLSEVATGDDGIASEKLICGNFIRAKAQKGNLVVYIKNVAARVLAFRLQGFTFSMKTIGEHLGLSEVATGDDGTASEKLITDTGYSELNLSVDTVMSNEDLSVEILLRLPVISLLLFKVVSKHWLSVITSTNFTSRLSRIPSMAPASGLFIRWPNRCKISRLEYEYDFISLDSRLPSKRSITTISCGSETGCIVILDSCNGLLLTQSGSYPYKLYVCNPTINLFKMLPLHSITINRGAIMAFDPTISPHYKVFSVGRKDGAIQIQTYSSETNSWSVCGLQYPCEHFTYFNNAVYWNDAIHWLKSSSQMPLHAMLDVVNNTVLTTKLPTPFYRNLPWDHKFFRSRQCLLLICKEHHCTRKLFVYEMKNRNSRWFMKYIINLDDVIMNPFPNKYCSIGLLVWCYVLGEREEDSFMVINLCGKVVEYKPLVKTFRELLILDKDCACSSHEFIPSFAGL